MTQTAVVQFNPDQLALIRQTVAKGTNEAEFRLFIEVCRYHGLNPFARQIYAVVRESYNNGRQLTIQTSIDGYRLLAERSGKYAGQIGPQWCDESGEWKDVWLSDKSPAAARVGVLRKDFDQPVWGVAKYRSYAQTKKDGTPTTMWQKMPDVMLAKCAESLALRKAFPAEMSGIYTKEEMDQADNDLPTVAPLHSTTVESDPAPTSAPTASAEHKPVQGNQGASTGQVQRTEQSNGSTPAPAPREAKAAEPVPPPKASEQQVASIRKLCTHTGMSEPENLADMPYFEAKALLEELTAEYKKQRLGQIKKRIEAVGVKWEDAKTDKKLRGIKDEALTINQLNLLNNAAAEYEQNQATPKAS